MIKLVRSFVLAAAGALLLGACGGIIGLPDPVPLPTAFGFGEGIDVSLTAAAPAGVVAAQTGATYSGSIDESFSIDAADIPGILKTLVRIDGVTETITLGTTLTATTAVASAFPASFVASDAELTDLTVRLGGSVILGPLDFTGLASAEMTFTAVGDCGAVTSCTYAASAQVDLLEIGLTGATANDFAKEIVGGGNFNVQAAFSVFVDPEMPEGTTITAVVIGTGAVLE